MSFLSSTSRSCQLCFKNAAGKVFRGRKANKNIHPHSDIKKNPLCPTQHFLAREREGGGGSQSFVLFPLKFITEALPPSSHRTDRVPRDLHFRHYCQVPLTPFFLPFYLQQLIRVPLPFSLLDDVSVSPVKPFHFSARRISKRTVFCVGLSSVGNWGVSVKTKTLHFKLFRKASVLNPLMGVWRITYPFDSCIMDVVEMFR